MSNSISFNSCPMRCLPRNDARLDLVAEGRAGDAACDRRLSQGFMDHTDDSCMLTRAAPESGFFKSVGGLSIETELARAITCS